MKGSMIGNAICYFAIGCQHPWWPFFWMDIVLLNGIFQLYEYHF